MVYIKKKNLAYSTFNTHRGDHEDLEKVTDLVSATIMQSANMELCCFQMHTRNSYLQTGMSLFRIVMHLSRKQNMELDSYKKRFQKD